MYVPYKWPKAPFLPTVSQGTRKAFFRNMSRVGMSAAAIGGGFAFGALALGPSVYDMSHSRGMAAMGRHRMTDFGSPWKGALGRAGNKIRDFLGPRFARGPSFDGPGVRGVSAPNLGTPGANVAAPILPTTPGVQNVASPPSSFFNAGAPNLSGAGDLASKRMAVRQQYSPENYGKLPWKTYDVPRPPGLASGDPSLAGLAGRPFRGAAPPGAPSAAGGAMDLEGLARKPGRWLPPVNGNAPPPPPRGAKRSFKYAPVKGGGTLSAKTFLEMRAEDSLLKRGLVDPTARPHAAGGRTVGAGLASPASAGRLGAPGETIQDIMKRAPSDKKFAAMMRRKQMMKKAGRGFKLLGGAMKVAAPVMAVGAVLGATALSFGGDQYSKNLSGISAPYDPDEGIFMPSNRGAPMPGSMAMQSAMGGGRDYQMGVDGSLALSLHHMRRG